MRWLLVPALLALAAIPALADEVESEARVKNKAPVVVQAWFETEDDDASSPGMQIVPTPGEDRAVALRAQVRDDNGHPDIREVNATLLGPDNVTVVVEPTAWTKVEQHGRSATYAGTIPVPYWLAPGEYHVLLEALDRPGAIGRGTTTFAVLESLAMATGSSAVAFGTLEPGAATAPSAVNVQNIGNLAIDLEVAGTDLVAPEASIPAGRVKASLAESMDPMVALAPTPTRFADFDLEPGDDAARDIWFSLHVPSGDEQYVPQATYRGSITLSAVVSS